MSKLVATVQAEEKFNKNGKATLNLKDDWAPATFIPDLVATHTRQRKRLGAAAQSNPAQQIVHEVASATVENASELLRHMEVARYPDSSRRFLSEVLHDLIKTAETESPVLSQEIVNHVVQYGLKSGKIMSALLNADGVRRAAGGGNANAGGVGNRGGANNRREGGREPQFVFEPSKHSKQSLPSEGAKLCFACVNVLFKQGKLSEGEQPPESCFFSNFVELQKHKRSGKCLGSKKPSS
jgi:hypothetical protein